MRRTPGTSVWHQANDDLAGTDVYGTYGTDTSDSMFSIAWNTWSFTEMLFMTGTHMHAHFDALGDARILPLK